MTTMVKSTKWGKTANLIHGYYRKSYAYQFDTDRGMGSLKCHCFHVKSQPLIKKQERRTLIDEKKEERVLNDLNLTLETCKWNFSSFIQSV